MRCYLFKDVSEVAGVLGISESSVHRYSHLFRVTGDVRPIAKRNGPAKELSEFEVLFLVNLVLTMPGIYLRELQDELCRSLMHWVDLSTICRTLHSVGMTRQVLKQYAIQRSEVKRAEFWMEVAYIDPSMIVWIDETGFDRRNSLRKFGYGIRGSPPVSYSLKLRGRRYSAIGILSTDGIEDVLIVDESVDGEKFLLFVRKCLLPILMPFNGHNPKSVVVLDNASIHHTAAVEETIRSVGAIVRFLPPYSPDMNPLEEVFAEVKKFLAANDPILQSTQSPSTIINHAFLSVSMTNCNAYIAHAGYAECGS